MRAHTHNAPWPRKDPRNAAEFRRILGKTGYWIKGDHAGSEAPPGVSTRLSLRPVMSTDQIWEPRPPCAVRVNITNAATMEKRKSVLDRYMAAYRETIDYSSDLGDQRHQRLRTAGR